MATDVDVDLGSFMDDIEEVLNDLEGEEEVEQQVMQEQQEAEQALAEALKELKGDGGSLRALIYFREVDFDAPHAEVHQQVEKILRNINEIGSAQQLQKQLQDIHHAIGKVERALEELQDVYQKTEQDVKHQQQDIEDLREIQQVIGKLQQGAEQYSHWAQGQR
ncbi:MAG: hypothetical protein ABEK00_02075 [Candidatus Nanohaloarchaea archaeon]